MVREIVAQRFAAETSGSWPGVASWLSQLENPEWQSLITEILADNRPVRDVETLLKGSSARDGAVKILRDKNIDLQLAALNQRLADPDLKEDEQSRILTQIQHLRKLKKQPLAAKSEEGEGLISGHGRTGFPCRRRFPSAANITLCVFNASARLVRGHFHAAGNRFRRIFQTASGRDDRKHRRNPATSWPACSTRPCRYEVSWNEIYCPAGCLRCPPDAYGNNRVAGNSTLAAHRLADSSAFEF